MEAVSKVLHVYRQLSEIVYELDSKNELTILQAKSRYVRKAEELIKLAQSIWGESQNSAMLNSDLGHYIAPIESFSYKYDKGNITSKSKEKLAVLMNKANDVLRIHIVDRFTYEKA